MRTGTRKSFTYVAVTACVTVVGSGLVGIKSFHQDNELAADQPQTVNRVEKAERLPFPEHAHSVVRSQKADLSRTIIAMFTQDEFEAAGYHIIDQVTINWVGPDAVLTRTIDDPVQITTGGDVEQEETSQVSRGSTPAAAPDKPVTIIPVAAPAESTANLPGEPPRSDIEPNSLLSFPRQAVSGAGRWFQDLIVPRELFPSR